MDSSVGLHILHRFIVCDKYTHFQRVAIICCHSSVGQGNCLSWNSFIELIYRLIINFIYFSSSHISILVFVQFCLPLSLEVQTSSYIATMDSWRPLVLKKWQTFYMHQIRLSCQMICNCILCS